MIKIPLWKGCLLLLLVPLILLGCCKNYKYDAIAFRTSPTYTLFSEDKQVQILILRSKFLPVIHLFYPLWDLYLSDAKVWLVSPLSALAISFDLWVWILASNSDAGKPWSSKDSLNTNKSTSTCTKHQNDNHNSKFWSPKRLESHTNTISKTFSDSNLRNSGLPHLRGLIWACCGPFWLQKFYSYVEGLNNLRHL